MKVSIKIISCLFVFCLLGASSVRQKTYKVSAGGFKLAQTESIAGFEMYYINGSFRTFSNAPSDWKIVLNTWDEDDQRHWNGSLKGQSGHGSGNLGMGEFLEILIIMDASDPDFNLKFNIFIEDHDNDTKRTVVLTKKQLLLTPVNDQPTGGK